MEQIIAILTEYGDKWPWLAYTLLGFSGVGSLITSTKAMIKKSVSLKDDAWLASVEAKVWAKWIIDFFEFFSAVKPKEVAPAAPEQPDSK